MARNKQVESSRQETTKRVDMYIKDNNLTTLAGVVRERFLMSFKGQANKFGFHCLGIKKNLGMC